MLPGQTVPGSTAGRVLIERLVPPYAGGSTAWCRGSYRVDVFEEGRGDNLGSVRFEVR
jgi:hypothetical protein